MSDDALVEIGRNLERMELALLVRAMMPVLVRNEVTERDVNRAEAFKEVISLIRQRCET